MTRRRMTWIVAIPAAAGIAMLLYGIGAPRPMWVDEQMLMLNVRDRSFAHLAGALWLDQSAPYGWLVLERLLMLTFGAGERSVRLLTMLFGTCTLVTAAWIGRRWMTTLGAVMLVALCATGEWLVFFTLELKHYSADTFGALLVPALVVWALDARSDGDLLMRRTIRWWIVAACAQWFSNGALFVTPACAVVLTVGAWRRAGWPVWRAVAAGASVWALSFGVNYAVVLRHALENAYLKNYWAFAFPPIADGAAATLRWAAAQFRPFAVKPAGSGLPVTFWIVWGIGVGFAVIRRRALGIVAIVVPVSAAVLAVLHVVPTFERLALWVVPALYVGVGLCGDAAVQLWRSGRARYRVIAAVCAAATAAAAIAVAADTVERGLTAFRLRPRSNYGLDDRSSVRWLLATHRSGDPVLATHYGLAAIWWYGRVNIAGPNPGSRLNDGSPLFEIKFAPPEECGKWNEEMTRVLGGYSRAMVYLGFRLNVEPPDFDTRVLDELSRRGLMVSYKEYAEVSRIAAFDLTQSSAHRTPAHLAPGCVSITPASRW